MKAHGRLISIEIHASGTDPKAMTDLVGRSLSQARLINSGDGPLCVAGTRSFEHTAPGARAKTTVTTTTFQPEDSAP